MQVTAEIGAARCHLAHLRRYPITLSVGTASPGQVRQVLTPSLSELSAFGDTGSLSAIVCRILVRSQSGAS